MAQMSIDALDRDVRNETGEFAIPTDEAADIIWATNSPELYAMLVQQRGWSAQRYGDWLVHSWICCCCGVRRQ